MSALPETPYYLTPEQYLAFDRESEVKHEYADKKIWAMAGAKENHNLICTNIVRKYGNQISDNNCKIYQSDMRVQVSQTGSYRYPDIVVVCGKTQFADDEEDTLVNPTVLIEVLSKSTAEKDRTTKAWEYRQIASLQDYLIISPDEAMIEWYHREEDETWRTGKTRGLDTSIELASIQCTLTLADVYEKLVLSEDVS